MSTSGCVSGFLLPLAARHQLAMLDGVHQEVPKPEDLYLKPE